MLTTTATYDTENAKSAKTACYIIIFNGIASPKFCSNSFSGRTSTYKKLIKRLHYESQAYEPLEPLLTRARLTFTLTDNSSSDIIGLINGNILLGDTVTLKSGYSALTEANFVTMPTFTVRKIRLESNKIDHTFICEESDSFDPIYNDTLFKDNNETYLTSAINDSATTINVGSTTNLIDPASVPSGVKVAIVIIENEMIAYTGTLGGNQLTSCTRGYQDTTAQDHAEGSIVRAVYIFNESFGQAALRLLTTTGSGVNGRYDSNISNGFSPKIPSSEIDLTQIEYESHRFHCWYEDGAVANVYDEQFQYPIYKERKIRDVLKELLRPFNAVLYKNTSDQLSLKVLDLPRLETDILNQTLNDNKAEYLGMEYLDKLLINNILYRHDYNPANNKYQRQPGADTCNDSDTAYGTYPDYVVENKGLDYVNANTERYHSEDRFFLYYGNMLVKVKAKVLPQYWLYEPLDDIKLTSNFLPHYSDNNRTWSNEISTVMKKEIIHEPLQQRHDVFYDLLAYNIVNKANSLYSILTYDGNDAIFGSYDTDVSKSPTNDTTTEAADGFGEFDTGYSESNIYYIYVKLLIVLPGAIGQESYIEVTGRAMQLNGSFSNVGLNTIKVNYDSSRSDTITVWLPIYCRNDTLTASDRIKIDWHNTSGDDVSTITIDKYYIYKMIYS